MDDHGMEKKEDHQPPAEHSEKAGKVEQAGSPEVTPNEQVLDGTNDDTTNSQDIHDTPENDSDTEEEEAEAEPQADASDDEAEDEEAAPPHTHPDETKPSEAEAEATPSGRESLDSVSTDSSASDCSRRTSERTEALIQAAARDIVEQVGADRGRESMNTETDESLISESEGYSARSSDAHAAPETCARESLGSEQESEYAEGGVEGSSVSQSRPASARPSDAHSVGQSVHSTRQSTGSDRESDTRRSSTAQSHHSTEDERSSSRNEENDDVFSDDSPRSSMGSLSESEHKKLEKMAAMDRSPRISDLSQYDRDEEFVPTVRGAPRPVFRSPSSVKAMQMSSPTPSVYGSSPRSGRRGMPTVSRLGSPSLSAQYSPKKTPPRFKRTTPPLVLLHVTLLPLRWGWGDILERARPDELSQDAKTVRDAWRLLQDRMGDTTVERGILLPHPQNDYEVLEERLLEALELPCRRRARILECGHYLGPSNEMTLIEDSDSEEDDYYDEDRRDSHRSAEQVHWCKTCRSEIRYDALGPAKIFRVKVYASNGLMKAGAWEACWKEMERVDVELEPLVDGVVQEEMNRLEIEQERELEEQEREMDMREQYDDDYGIPEEEYSDEDELEEDNAAAKGSEDPEDRDLRQSADDDLPDLPPNREELPEEVPQQEPEIPDEADAEVHNDHSKEPSEHSDVEDYAEHDHADGDRDASFMDHDSTSRIPTPEPHVETPEERERRDEERLREMYGHEASREDPSAEPMPSHTRQMPSEQPRDTQQKPKNDSLPDLLLQSGRVVMQDKKNVIIGLLSILILMLAVRSGGQSQSDPRTFQTLVVNQEMATVTVTHVPTQDVQLMTTQAQPSLMAEESQVIQLDTRDDAQAEVEGEVAKNLAPENLAEESPADEEPVEEQDEVEEVQGGDEVRENYMIEAKTPGAHHLEAEEGEEGALIVQSTHINEQGLLDASDSELTEMQQLSVEASAALELSREIETVVSERIIRVVETVTEVETATVKVTETISLPTETAEPEAVVEANPEAEVDLDSETEVGVNSETEADVNSEAEPQVEASASIEAVPEASVAADVSSESGEIDSEDQTQPTEDSAEDRTEELAEMPTEVPVEQPDGDHAEEHDAEPTLEISGDLEAEVIDTDAVESETLDDDLESESVPEREL